MAKGKKQKDPFEFPKMDIPQIEIPKIVIPEIKSIDIEGMRGEKTKAAPSKKKRRPIDKNTRDAVWIKYMGNKVEGKCYCCGIRTIHITDFQVGHNKAVAKEGKDNISNLRPICGPCNRGMRTMSIEQYKAKYFGKKPETKPKKKKTAKK